MNTISIGVFYVYLSYHCSCCVFIYLCIESRGLATFWCYCYLFYNVPAMNKIFLLLLHVTKSGSRQHRRRPDHDDVNNWKHFRVTGPLCGEFTDRRWIPLTKASDVELRFFFALLPNKGLSKQSRRRWFETPSRSLWRQCNALIRQFRVGSMFDPCRSDGVIWG